MPIYCLTLFGIPGLIKEKLLGSNVNIFEMSIMNFVSQRIKLQKSILFSSGHGEMLCTIYHTHLIHFHVLAAEKEGERNSLEDINRF